MNREPLVIKYFFLLVIVWSLSIRSGDFVRANDSLFMLQNQLTTVSTNELPAYYLKMAALTTRVDQKLAYCYSAVDAARSLNGERYLQTLLLAGETLNYPFGIRHARNFLSTAAHVADSLGRRETTPRIDHLMGVAECLSGNFSEAQELLHKALVRYGILKQGNETAEVYLSLGQLNDLTQNYLLAIDYYSRALELGKQLQSSAIVHQSSQSLAQVYEYLQRYNEALQYRSQSLDFASVLDLSAAQAGALMSMGNIYVKIGKPDKAGAHYSEALKRLTAPVDSGLYCQITKKMADLEVLQGNFAKAMAQYRQVLAFYLAQKDAMQQAFVYMSMGLAEKVQKHYAVSLDYFQKSLNVNESMLQPVLLAQIYRYMGDALALGGDQSEAEHSYRKSEAICVQHQFSEELAQVYSGLSSLYAANRQYDTALQFQSRYAALKDTLLTKETMGNLARMEALFKALREEEQLSLLRHENNIKSNSLEREKSIRLILMTAMLILLLSLGVLIYFFHSRRKTMRQLEEKNKRLAELNATKDKFFSIIAHDLKSPFNSLLGFSEVLAIQAESKNSEQVSEYSQLIYNSARKLYYLVENLLQWSRTQIGSLSFQPERLDVGIHTQNILSILKMNAEEKDILILPKIEQHLSVWADPNQFNTILRNLVSNSIKFSKVGSSIQVVAVRDQQLVRISVIDQGTGMRKEQLDHLFSINQSQSIPGTMREKGTGLGLILCKEFVAMNKGKIWVESEYGKGSAFHFTLPLTQNQ